MSKLRHPANAGILALRRVIKKDLDRLVRRPRSRRPARVHRSGDPAAAEALGHALAKVLAGRSALLVASTDLSHFYSQAVANQLKRG